MQALEDGTADLPSSIPLPGTDVPFPYVFVGDEAFPLSTYMMRPFLEETLICLIMNVFSTTDYLEREE